MTQPITKSCNQIYAKLVADVMNNGYESAPRGMKVRELLNYSVTLENPRDRCVTWPQRKLPKRYLGAEWLWYLSGNRNASAIAEYAPFWASIADDTGNINSNYGHRLFGYTAEEGTTEIKHHQFDTIVEILKRDKDSRQAICHINLPNDVHMSLHGSKDVPCTLNLAFHIRNDELSMIVTMRSNDAVTGYTIDIFQFTMMQELMWCLLKPTYPDLKLGKYYHTAYSMHFYERDWEMCRSIMNDFDLWQAGVDNMPAPIVMGEMTFLQDDPWLEIAYLVEIEKQIRGNKEPDLESIPEFSMISPYWQNFMSVCFDKRRTITELGLACK